MIMKGKICALLLSLKNSLSGWSIKTRQKRGRGRGRLKARVSEIVSEFIRNYNITGIHT